ncbi:D-alanyl-D-alanine carboxypeptidase/D-alanyl-D-alanine-endopeptidase [Oceanobacillus bengalensis]|nr:D-alanyl-D-alanine carboxypeptidase/D-alanyl-D-alanine-endopeptidase [Oceanobacillus bengalensis]
MFNRNYIFPILLLVPLIIFIVLSMGNSEHDTLLTSPQVDELKSTIVNAEETTTSTLEDKLDKIVNDERLKGAMIGISVRKADTGEEIYHNHGDTRLHPASNMKILTVAAALDTLGPEYRFITEVLTDGEINGNALNGNLYIKGKGDPTLLNEDLNQLAGDLRDQGIEAIEGNLIGDDSWYDAIRLSQDLNWSDEPYYTGAQVSALTLSPNSDYDTGTVIVEVYPGNETAIDAQIKVIPNTDYVKVINKTETVAAGGSRDISIEREHGTNNIVVEGTIPLDGNMYRSWASVWEPTKYVLDVFKTALKENGISVKGVKTGVTPDGAELLTSRKSIPLKEIVIPFMKLSNNGLGEVLTKEMGKVVHGEGSWDKGLEVIRDVAATLNVDPNTILLRDGSGMSHKTYIPASEITSLLHTVQGKEWHPVFESSLPVAGNLERLVGGTLRNRMTFPPLAGNVVAKTGTLTGVLTLSGYVTTVNGEKLIFSILNNNHIIDNAEVAALQDEMVTILATHEFK